MHIQELFDPTTFTLTFVVHEGRDAVVIDAILDYDQGGSRTSTRSLDNVEDYVKSNDLRVHWVLETHPHADHLSGAQTVRDRFGAKLAIGERVREVQETFKKIFDLPDSFATDGSQFDRLLKDGDVIEAGALSVRAIATPGHTPACMTYAIGDAIFTGDLLFVEDYGTGRTDFPKGSAPEMWESIQKLYAMPDATRVFPCHDYLPHGRALRTHTTIGVSKLHNIMLKAETTKEEFVRLRTERDKTLRAPQLLYPSVQVNIDGGRLPAAHANGRRYLTIPIQ